MKQKFTLVLIITAFCFLKFNDAKAQVNVQDSLALVDLYNSTNGPGWKNHNNWLTTISVANWYGITVTGNRVTAIFFYDNNLSGLFPISLTKLTSLQSLTFVLNDNLTGVIPASISKLTNLQTLYLGGNHLSGGIPSSIGKLSSLTFLFLGDNDLSGSIPPSLGNLKQVLVIDLSHNNLTGRIPSFNNDINLQQLILWNNNLSGSIPSSLGDFTQLQVLDLGNNDLSGKVPQSLGNLLSNTNIALENNRLTFTGLEELSPEFPNLLYAPQANIPITQNGNLFSVDAGGTIANNTYKWYRNGKPYRTKTGNATLSASNDGAYTVEVTNAIATKLTLHGDTVNYAAFNNTVAAATINKIKPAYIYPNPATTTANVYFNASGKYVVTVTDVSGKPLQTKTGFATTNQNLVQLNVSSYANGLYFINISDENSTQTLKLNKQ